jgi:ubiquinone/menaquinone biosynthesis C-methylase UbiE
MESSVSLTPILDLNSGSSVNLVPMADDTVIPNHHRDYPGFSGPSGLLAATSMLVGRDGDARFAAELGRVAPEDVVVDIGCGPGGAARYAARLGTSVTGVDPAPVMLRVARALTRSRNVRYVEGAAEALPLPDDFARVVWSIATVHHWRDVDDGLREVRRVRQPGGRFIAIERRTLPGAAGLASHGWTDEQAEVFARVCTDQGFAEASVEQPRQSGRRSIIAVTATAP